MVLRCNGRGAWVGGARIEVVVGYHFGVKHPYICMLDVGGRDKRRRGKGEVSKMLDNPNHRRYAPTQSKST